MVGAMARDAEAEPRAGDWAPLALTLVEYPKGIIIIILYDLFEACRY